MVFSSIPFLFFFLPLCLVLYYAVPFRAKNYILLAFSLIFYAWGEPFYILLMLLASEVDYVNGRLIGRFGNSLRRRRLFLCVSVLINLSVLGFFKYADFAVETVNALFRLSVRPPGLGLPVGISFYTFQSMSYSIDRYRGTVPVEKNYFTYLTYVSMFPQLVAGPIVRFSTVQEELHRRTIDRDGFVEGMLRFFQGLFKKVLIANLAGELWEQIRALEAGQASAATAWLGITAFTLQLYFDFSAYSDMAIGMGRMLGFHFPENFRYPLSAISVTDFWRRWHISLSSWFRDYVYIPLGGNRVGTARHLRNILTVWILTGLWHGAAWNFVLWGLYYGILLALEKYIWGRKLGSLPRWLQHIYTLFIVISGFLLFVIEDRTEFFTYLRSLFAASGNSWFGTDTLWYLSNYAAVLLPAAVLAFPVYPWLKEKIRLLSEGAKATDGSGVETPDDTGAETPDGTGARTPDRTDARTPDGTGARTPDAGLSLLLRAIPPVSAAGYLILFLLSVACLVSDTYNPFLYFRF